MATSKPRLADCMMAITEKRPPAPIRSGRILDSLGLWPRLRCYGTAHKRSCLAWIILPTARLDLSFPRRTIDPAMKLNIITAVYIDITDNREYNSLPNKGCSALVGWQGDLGTLAHSPRLAGDSGLLGLRGSARR